MFSQIQTIDFKFQIVKIPRIPRNELTVFRSRDGSIPRLQGFILMHPGRWCRLRYNIIFFGSGRSGHVKPDVFGRLVG